MKLTAIRTALNMRNIHHIEQLPYKFQIPYAIGVLVFSVTLGNYIDKQDMYRQTRFRDKSALYGKEKGPDDPPSWGEKDYYWKFSQWPKSRWY